MTSATLDPSTAAAILFGIFFTLMFLRVPIAFALGLACLPIFAWEDRLDPQGLIQETFNAYNSFILLAVPFFLLTANLMGVGGITDRLVRFSTDPAANASFRDANCQPTKPSPPPTVSGW